MPVTQAETPNSLLSKKLSTVVFFALATYANIQYGIATSHSDHDGPDWIHTNAFSANSIFIFIFWILTFGFQLLYLSQVFSAEPAAISGSITYHFSVFNILHFVWAWLFARGHLVLALVVTAANFFNVLALYISHKTYSLRPASNFVFIHVPVSALPMAWTFYNIFWTGAAAFHANGLFSRIIANVLIWDFLIVPVLILFFYRDWAFGFAVQFLTWGIGVHQLFYKVIALQWGFAFTCAAITFVLTVLTAVGLIFKKPAVDQVDAENERAPLISNQN